MYTLTIPTKSLDTLAWLAARGYDAGFSDLAEFTSETDGKLTMTLRESDAWQWLENIEADPYAFLTCCGDSDLSDALLNLWQAII